MKKMLCLATCAAVALSACSQATPVAVVKAGQDTTIANTNRTQVQQDTSNVPKNVTAICRDGSYSQAKDSSACIGNGGVQTYINHYFSD